MQTLLSDAFIYALGLFKSLKYIKQVTAPKNQQVNKGMLKENQPA